MNTEFNRDKAITLLESIDNRWVYEDMEDSELLERLSMDFCPGDFFLLEVDSYECQCVACTSCWRMALG